MYHPFPEDRARAIALAQEHVRQDPLFLDTETTGLSDMDEICEIAIVDVAGNVLINSLVKPTRLIAAPTSQIHGITNEMVAAAPTFKDLLPELERILRGREVLIYNRDFDMTKIGQSARANGCGFADGEAWYWSHPTGEQAPEGYPIYHSAWHCAMNLYAMYYGDWNDYHESYRWQRLTSAALQCGIDLPLGAHRALADAEICRRVVLHMAAQEIPDQHDEEQP